MTHAICRGDYSYNFNHNSFCVENNYVYKNIDSLKKLLNGSSDSNKRFKSGIRVLDELFDGGLLPGLYVMGGIPGAGKTSFCLQLADSFAINGYDVLYFSLEMSEEELIKKSLSRISYISNKDNAYSYFEVPSAIVNRKELEEFNTLYNDYIRNIYIHEVFITPNKITLKYSTNHIKTALLNYKDCHHKEPILIIDYLQVLNYMDDDNSDIRQDIINIINELKSFSRDFNIPVFVISSLNRSSYSRKSREDLSLDCFKESGGIEYTADCAMVLTTESVDDDTVEVSINVLKNRFGPSGVSFSFDFIPKYSFFKETSD